jgi:diacylglycerol kinase family enzyme
VATLRRNGHGVEVWPSWEGGDLVRLTRTAMAEAGASGVDTIIAAGGDGTVNAVFGTAVAHDLPEGCSFGILPLGTAKDFARSAGLPVGDLTAALRIAASAPPVAMDIGLLGERPFVNLLTGGFGSQVTADRSRPQAPARRSRLRHNRHRPAAGPLGKRRPFSG